MQNEETIDLQNEQVNEKKSKTFRVPVFFQMEVEFEVEAVRPSDAISKACQWDTNGSDCLETDGWCEVGEYYDCDNNCVRDRNEMRWEIRNIEFSTHKEVVELEG